MLLSRIDRFCSHALAALLGLLATLLLLAALVWLGYQALHWLQAGVWIQQPPVKVWVRDWYPQVYAFINAPHDWIGLARALRMICDLPTGLALAAMGAVLAVLNVSVADRRLEAPRRIDVTA